MNILVTNYDNSGEDVLVMVEEPLSLSHITLAIALTAKKKHFDDCYPIEDKERCYYLFDPLWADETFVNNANRIAEANKGLWPYIKQRIGHAPVKKGYFPTDNQSA